MPQPSSFHASCTPSPVWFTAWVAGAGQGLPCGSPVKTLITQVSGSAGGGEGPRGRTQMAPCQFTPGPSSSFMSLVPRAGRQAGRGRGAGTGPAGTW